MKTTVYLVRHGETEWNLSGRFQGCVDTELSDAGIAQAKKISEILLGKFDYIYSSPLKRAFVTADRIAAASGLSPIADNGLIEINFGLWEGLTLKEMETKYPKEFKLWRTDRLLAPLCGGDLSLKHSSERGRDAIINLVNAHRGSRIVAVSHGGLIKVALIGLFEWDMTMYHKIVIGNTSITTIAFNSDSYPKLITLNDVNHVI